VLGLGLLGGRLLPLSLLIGDGLLFRGLPRRFILRGISVRAGLVVISVVIPLGRLVRSVREAALELADP
jgi:hypothetical protein